MCNLFVGDPRQVAWKAPACQNCVGGRGRFRGASTQSRCTDGTEKTRDVTVPRHGCFRAKWLLATKMNQTGSRAGRSPSSSSHGGIQRPTLFTRFSVHDVVVRSPPVGYHWEVGPGSCPSQEHLWLGSEWPGRIPAFYVVWDPIYGIPSQRVANAGDDGCGVPSLGLCFNGNKMFWLARRAFPMLDDRIGLHSWHARATEL